MLALKRAEAHRTLPRLPPLDTSFAVIVVRNTGYSVITGKDESYRENKNLEVCELKSSGNAQGLKSVLGMGYEDLYLGLCTLGVFAGTKSAVSAVLKSMLFNGLI